MFYQILAYTPHNRQDHLSSQHILTKLRIVKDSNRTQGLFSQLSKIGPLSRLSTLKFKKKIASF